MYCGVLNTGVPERNNRRLIADVLRPCGNPFRDHCWVDNLNTEDLHLGELYTFKADTKVYALGSKVTLANITNIKEFGMAYTSTRSGTEVFITLQGELGHFQTLLKNMTGRLAESVLARIENCDYGENGVISLNFRNIEDAAIYKGYVVRSSNEGKSLMKMLREFNAVWPIVREESGVPTTTEEQFTVRFMPPKALDAFKRYPDINAIQVKGTMLVNRSIMDLVGRDLTATRSGPNYAVEGHIVHESMLKLVITRIQAELVTTAVMDPSNFVRLEGDYIVSYLEDKEVKVHQTFISRHGETFIVEKGDDGLYREVGTELPIPVEIMNMRTLRD